MGQEPSMEQHAFNLKFTSRQLTKQAQKSEAAALLCKKKCKQAMEAGNMDAARVHAESAIREKSQAQTYLRLSSRLMAVQQRIESAIRMNNLTKTMKGVVKSMDDMMAANMDVVKMTQILDKFEQQFTDLDVLDKSMATSFDSTLATTTPELDVENLMFQVADEHGLEFESELDGVGKVKAKQQVQVESAPQAKQAVLIGDDSASRKKPDQPPAGGAAAPAAPAGSSDQQISDLEARLRRLQGM